MFIRDDLLDKIKEIYGTEEFLYTNIDKNIYGHAGVPFLMFTTDTRLIAIAKSSIKKNAYYLEFAAKDKKNFRCYLCDGENYTVLESTGNETILTKVYSKVYENNTVEYRFPGEAFNFDQEFVIAALENVQEK